MWLFFPFQLLCRLAVYENCSGKCLAFPLSASRWEKPGKVREKQYPPAGGAGTQECNVLVYALTLAVCPSAAPVALD